MARFKELAIENDGEMFHNQAFRKGALNRIRGVLYAICIEYINFDDWDLSVHNGSVTLQKKNTPSRVIKIFIDYEDNLKNKFGMTFPETERIVIGFELGSLDPFIRKSVRCFLRDSYNNGTDWYYADPFTHCNCPKIYLKRPRGNSTLKHYYDILFLPNGDCEFDEDDEIIEEIDEILRLNESFYDDVEV